jgi:hypothetical protein
VGDVRRCAAAQVDHRGHQQHDVDQRHTDQQCRAHPPPAQEIPGRQAGAQEHPEPDLAGRDQCHHQHAGQPDLARGQMRQAKVVILSKDRPGRLDVF